jgi:nicotinamide-nucleotide amidase
MFDNEKINRIKEKMTATGQSIAVAESVTAGWLQAALSTAEHAMEFFEGGLTAYNLGQKAKQLNVNPVHALRCNCVSEQTAQEMAKGVSRQFISNWGIGVTGYSTPIPESGDKVFAIAALSRDGEILKTIRMEAGERLGPDAQLFYVETVLSALEDLLN